MSGRRWPPPGYPIVEGDHALTAEWAIMLPEKFARRVEDGDLVLWRPGLTLWLAVWGNDRNESPDQRLQSLKSIASPERFDERESRADGVPRHAYRLREDGEEGPVESIMAHVFNDAGHLQVSVYFDDPAEEGVAWGLVESLRERTAREHHNEDRLIDHPFSSCPMSGGKR